jgi:hypothetical protein
MRRASILVVWLATAIIAASAVSCTRIVDLDPPDASLHTGDGGTDGAFLPDGGFDNGDGGLFGDGAIDDGAIGDASAPDAF